MNSKTAVCRNGYEPFKVSEILVGSGKEVVLDIELNETLQSLNEVKSTEGKYTFRSTVNHKLNQKINSRTGITLNSLFFDNTLKKAFRDRPEEMFTFVDNSGTVPFPLLTSPPIGQSTASWKIQEPEKTMALM